MKNDSSEKMLRYCVTYLSPGGIHYRFRCVARDKRQARKICRDHAGIADRDIVDVVLE